MHQICVYLGRDGRWCYALRQYSDPDTPPSYWSDWYTSLDLCLLYARQQAVFLWPNAVREWCCVELAGPRAYQWREAAMEGQRGS